MGALGDLPHGRWVRDHAVVLTPGQRSSLLGGIVVAAALVLLAWRGMADVASGSDSRVVAVGTPVPGLGADDRRFALIVAVDRYDDPSLPSIDGPGRDPEELHGALTTHAGFPPANIRRVDGSGPDAMSPTRSNVLRAFHELLAAIPDDGNALLLVSFSGRGTMTGGRAYLLPRDAATRSGDALLAATSIDFDADIRRQLQARRLKQVVLLVDSSLGAPGGPGGALDPEFVRATALDGPPLEAAVVVHSTSPGSGSYMTPDEGRSVFSQAMVEGVRGAATRTADGWITLGSLLRYVAETVPERARSAGAPREQRPTVATSGFSPDGIRFARVTPPTASSSGDLRCALREPGGADGGLYTFGVEAADASRATTIVEAVHVVSGGVLGTPFARPMPLGAARAWPIRRTAARRPLLAIARTSIGQCAAYMAPSAGRAPVYRVAWRAANAEGVAYKEVFRHPTEDRRGRTDAVAAGTDTLRDREGRITSVEYSCEGAACGWSYDPRPDGGYGADVTVNDPPRSFSWRRRWESDPALDVYTAYYEMPVRVCVEGCP